MRLDGACGGPAQRQDPRAAWPRAGAGPGGPGPRAALSTERLSGCVQGGATPRRWWPTCARRARQRPLAERLHAAPRQVVADLRTLRTLAELLLRLDGVTFLGYLESLRASEAVGSVWLFHDAAHTIFEQAKRRVWALGGGGAAGKRKRAGAGGEPVRCSPEGRGRPAWVVLAKPETHMHVFLASVPARPDLLGASAP